MKKITTIAVAILFAFSLSTVQAQSSENTDVKSMNTTAVKTAPKAEIQTLVKQDVKTQLLKSWKFHEITLRTPKDGYLLHVAGQELGILHLLIANYTFHKDGSILLDEKHIEKQGVKEAKWEVNTSGKLEITYFWTAEKQKASGFSNDYEKMVFKIDLISGKELSLNLMDSFIVNLVTK